MSSKIVRVIMINLGTLLFVIFINDLVDICSDNINMYTHRSERRHLCVCPSFCQSHMICVSYALIRLVFRVGQKK